jgi:hypothetical protein
MSVKSFIILVPSLPGKYVGRCQPLPTKPEFASKSQMYTSTLASLLVEAGNTN